MRKVLEIERKVNTKAPLSHTPYFTKESVFKMILNTYRIKGVSSILQRRMHSREKRLNKVLLVTYCKFATLYNQILILYQITFAHVSKLKRSNNFYTSILTVLMYLNLNIAMCVAYRSHNYNYIQITLYNRLKKFYFF